MMMMLTVAIPKRLMCRLPRAPDNVPACLACFEVAVTTHSSRVRAAAPLGASQAPSPRLARSWTPREPRAASGDAHTGAPSAPATRETTTALTQQRRPHTAKAAQQANQTSKRQTQAKRTSLPRRYKSARRVSAAKNRHFSTRALHGERRERRVFLLGIMGSPVRFTCGRQDCTSRGRCRARRSARGASGRLRRRRCTLRCTRWQPRWPARSFSPPGQPSQREGPARRGLRPRR